MTMASLPLYKERQAAARGCCQSGSRTGRVCESKCWAKSGTAPAGPSAQHSPPQLRRGAYFQGSLAPPTILSCDHSRQESQIITLLTTASSASYIQVTSLIPASLS